MLRFRYVFELMLGKEDAYKCALWAFGKEFEDLICNDLLERWNNLHSDLFKLHPDGNLFIDISKIIAEWEKVNG